jgi:ABC-type antimicrobial peptide transport system permease subunit
MGRFFLIAIFAIARSGKQGKPEDGTLGLNLRNRSRCRESASLLFGTSPRDPLPLLIVGAVMTAVAAAACHIPAHRATRVDPLVALRHE